MSIKKEPVIAHIIVQYHALLLRYAARLLHNKHLASSVVKEVFESLYEQNKLIPELQLRSLLKTTTGSLCQSVDQSIARAEEALAFIFTQNNPSQN